jgi:hypothetical protein
MPDVNTKPMSFIGGSEKLEVLDKLDKEDAESQPDIEVSVSGGIPDVADGLVRS